MPDLPIAFRLAPTLLLAALLALCGCSAKPAAPAVPLASCHLKGLAQEAQCGSVSVPEDYSRPAGRKLSIRFAVIPAGARFKDADPLFVIAGGPGQSAVSLAGPVAMLFASLNQRRDLILVDQRGTGASAPLECAMPDPGRDPLALSLAHQQQAVAACAMRHERAGRDLRQYITSVAVRDFEAVRRALGGPKLNLWGVSYGTRAALEYHRQFPAAVRSIVLDSVAPADMALPASFARDAEAMLSFWLASCEAERECARRLPDLRANLQRWLAADTRTLALRAPDDGRVLSLTADTSVLTASLRTPLYAPQTARMLPFAIDRATRGDASALMALSSSPGDGLEGGFALGMHFAVLCSEDLPRVKREDFERRGIFGGQLARYYALMCASFPRAQVPDAFYARPSGDVPVLTLSGGLDPVTPPGHARALLAKMSHVRALVAPNLGHSVSGAPCAEDLITRFVRVPGAAIDGACLARIPRPTAFLPPLNGAER
ncbi:alpha/beta fold hydrolase [Niveibacterium terrae]|uniref:alpha/beta fold hydrolase n=1 Tax=Niveibacterium terrae TaxID=3373598 RepID=UPI003A93FDC6